MKSIITVQIGNSANSIGLQYWNQLIEEHQISTQPIGNDQLFFNQQFPRAILVDKNQYNLDKIIAQSNNIFKPDNFITDNSTTHGLMPIAMHQSSELIESVNDRLRKEQENSQNGISTFQIIDCLGSGQIGLSATIANMIDDNLNSHYTISQFPHLENEMNPLVIYNTILGVMYKSYCSLFNIYFDNKALFYHNQHKLFKSQDFSQINKSLCQSLCGITSSWRFNSQCTSGYLKSAVNLIPFPRLHCLTLSSAPLIKQNYNDIENLCNQIYDSTNQLFSISRGKYIAQAMTLRGSTNIFELEIQLKKVFKRKDIEFQKWIDNPIFLNSTTQQDLECHQLSLYSLNHTTGFAFELNKVLDKFTQLFRKKAYFYLYQQAGLVDQDLYEAQSTCGDIISEYMNYNYQNESTDE